MKAGNSNLEVGQKVQLKLEPNSVYYRLFNGCVGCVTHPFTFDKSFPNTENNYPEGIVGFYDPEDVLGLDHIVSAMSSGGFRTNHYQITTNDNRKHRTTNTHYTRHYL